MGDRLSTRVFPPFPDMDDGNSFIEPHQPHPDGRAWGRACRECALRRSDPQEIGQTYQQWIADGVGGCLFYCVHRHIDGYHRVCACYSALHPEQAITPASLTALEKASE